MNGRQTPSREAQKRALWIALFANAAFMGAEILGGFLFNSVALLADAVHMLSDVVGLGVALGAQVLMRRPTSGRHTYGLQRAEVMGALINGITMVGAVIWIVVEATRRFTDPEPVVASGLLVIAAIGLGVNLGSAFVLSRSRGESLNMRGAFLHMASDAAGSVAVIVAAGAAILWQATWADPAASLLIAILVLWASWALLRDTVHVLMEGVPRRLNVEEIEAAFLGEPAVKSVHHLHVWSVASDVAALSAHVEIDRESLHDAQLDGDRLKEILRSRFGVDHATLELECHRCAAEESVPVPSKARHRRR